MAARGAGLIQTLTAAALGVAAALAAGGLVAAKAGDFAESLVKPPGAVRVATFNASLSRGGASGVISALRDLDDPQIAAVAEIIQRVRPDILAVNELDHDPAGEAIALLQSALSLGRNGAMGVDYPHRYAAPVNSGVDSGADLDQDGARGGPGDAWGYGKHPGHYGMAILSRFPIDDAAVRTFRTAPLAEVVAAIPGLSPPARDGAPFYPPEIWAALPMASKSHWDAPVTLPSGARLHLLVSHPTPPVFDGPEDRNGLRNAAEIGFWRAYLDGADWIADDLGVSGGLAAGASAVVLGDLNLDAVDGAGRRSVMRALLAHPRLQDPRPSSPGAAQAAARQGGVNAAHRGDPSLDTADWRDAPRRGGGGAPGNLRVDYVLPTADLTVMGAGVFWPPPGDPLARLMGLREIETRDGRRFTLDRASDHRLVWVDIEAR